MIQYCVYLDTLMLHVGKKGRGGNVSMYISCINMMTGRKITKSLFLLNPDQDTTKVFLILDYSKVGFRFEHLNI